MRRTLVVLIILSVVGPVSAATGHDSLAPPGAAHQWLPDEPWVMEHRIPFDHAVLERELGLRGRRLEAYLFNDHHTLAILALRRGIEVEALADRLVAPWHGRVAPDRVAMLRERTMRLLTQGHLAQHVFFHVFHRLGLRPVSRRLFGVSSARLDVLRRRRHLTPLQIARRNGGAPKHVIVAKLRELVRARRDRGVSVKEAWPAQADRLLARQRQTLPCWVRSLTPTGDPGNPYGKARLLHPLHQRGWPFTASQRATDERAAEALRRRLEHTCWPRIRRWRWSPRLSAGNSPLPTAAPHSASTSHSAPAALRCSIA